MEPKIDPACVVAGAVVEPNTDWGDGGASEVAGAGVLNTEGFVALAALLNTD